jgi:PAS domain S-box-containing protein
LRRSIPAGALDVILDSSREAIICLDPGGNIVTWSRGAELAYGYSAQEAVGRGLIELLAPDDGGAQEQVRLALLAGGQVPRFEAVRRRKDGSRAEVSVTMQALRDAAGKLTGICLVECEAGEGRLAEEVARLQERDRLRTDFLTESAHELNTPLTPIRLQLQLLKLMQGLSPQERANVDAIERNVLRLGVLVQDMLDAARLQAGRFRLEKVLLDLGRLVEDAGGSFREQATHDGLRLVAPGVPRLMVEADATRTMQVLFNLLSNAVKFTPRGGEVEIGARRQGDEALVWVRDTGIGLTPVQLANLFRPFGRVHDGLPGVPKGTGLGLFISKGIVEEHGGRVWAESSGPNQGSTWWIALPLAPQQNGSEGPADSF